MLRVRVARDEIAWRDRCEVGRNGGVLVVVD